MSALTVPLLVTPIHFTTVGLPRLFEYTPCTRNVGSATPAVIIGASWRPSRTSTLSVSHSTTGCRSVRSEISGQLDVESASRARWSECRASRRLKVTSRRSRSPCSRR